MQAATPLPRNLAISAGLHLAVLLALIVVIPHPPPPPPPDEDTVAVEFTGTAPAVRKGETPSKVAAAADADDPSPEPPAKVAPTKAPIETAPPPPPPPPPPPQQTATQTLETAKIPPPPPTEAALAIKPPPPAHLPAARPPPDPVAPVDSRTSQPHPTKSATPDTHSFENTMEKLLAEQKQVTPPTHKYNPARGGVRGGGGAREGDATSLLTAGQMKQIGAEVRRCYAEDTAAKDYATYAAVIVVTIDETGEARLARLSPADQSRAGADPAFRAFAERAERAVLDPTCAKLPVPADLLGKPAQELTFRFRP